MAALALPIALVLGILGELAAILGARLGRDRRPVLPIGAGGIAEAGGATAAMLGSALVAAAVLDLIPGTIALVYLAAAVAAAGVRLTLGGDRGAARVVEVVAAEAAFAVAIGTMFFRFGVLDLDAVRGTQEVLGAGAGLEPVPSAVGLGAAALAATCALALRAAPRTEDAEDEDEGSSPTLLPWLAAWAVSGSVALLLAVFLAGGAIPSIAGGAGPRVVGVAAGIVLVAGLIRSVFSRTPAAGRAVVGVVAAIVAAAGAVAVAGS